MKNALIVFAKAPVVGQVKTRLAASVGEQAAMQIYEKLLNRNLKLAGELTAVDKVLYAYSTEDVDYFKRKLHWPIHIQPKGDLGVRMEGAIAANLCKYEAVVLIGADIVDAHIEDLVSAFDCLNRGVDMVLGPTYDGGYWLIGATAISELPFAGINWSSSRVFSQTRRRIRDCDLSYQCLPVRHDIDVEKDLVFANFL